MVAGQDVPTHAVVCFFQDVISAVCGEGRAKTVAHLVAEHGTHPVYELDVEGRRLAVLHPGVGAPLAAGFLEEAIALGCRTFVACGGAGALVPELVLGHVVVPTAALRDEGTSYHYLPPGREVEADRAAVAAVEGTLRLRGVPYVAGKTWTTDGLYRETRSKVERRRAEGCITVEMEAAAFFAVAAFRGVSFAQLLYAGDSLSGDEWDDRGWDKEKSVRERLFWLAAEACLSM